MAALNIMGTAALAQVASAGTLPACLSQILSPCGITSSQGQSQSLPEQEEDQLPLLSSQESEETDSEHAASLSPKTPKTV